MVTYWFPGFISSQDSESEACVLPPQEDVLLLGVWNWKGHKERDQPKLFLRSQLLIAKVLPPNPFLPLHLCYKLNAGD